MWGDLLFTLKLYNCIKFKKMKYLLVTIAVIFVLLWLAKELFSIAFAILSWVWSITPLVIVVCLVWAYILHRRSKSTRV